MPPKTVAEELLDRVATNCNLTEDEKDQARVAIRYYLCEGDNEPTWQDMKPARRTQVESAVVGVISVKYSRPERWSSTRTPFDTTRLSAAQMRLSNADNPGAGRQKAKAGRGGGRRR